MEYLTDEKINELVDLIAKNETLTPDEMEALTVLRDDLYARMSYMKDAEDYKAKYEDVVEKYRARWREGNGKPKEEEKEEEVTEESYESLWTEEKED